ncbi:myosin heavy chain, striated muscle-like [Cucurbita pepo subsp. pepo]|uniref:myosin heavy chain, striated muscle-like n=1 Tax=Cucurbita pepo subsp. pepo TaxID=3664 RepID=UPI000C9D8FDB|nr:myosin heavy chain, striated muscle-like [Cucurbita pepo subsp. pepo]
MFKSARWRSEKNRIKAEFKLQFCATQISEFGGDSLTISVVPGDVGKPTLRLEKATVRGGKCRWENPAYVTVKFDADQKTGKFTEKIYHFRVSSGLTKAGLLGEVSIDFAKYAETTKPFSASLPLHNSNSAVLHIWIQRIQEDAAQRDLEEFEDSKTRSQDESLSSYLNNEDMNKNSQTQVGLLPQYAKNDGLNDEAERNGDHRTSSGSDSTVSSYESSSGLDSPVGNGIRNNTHQQPNGFLSPLSHAPDSHKSPAHEENHAFPWKWSVQSDQTDDSGVNGIVGGRSKKETDIENEELKNELSVLSRRADMSDMELQTLRKQIAKENKRSHDLMSEVSSLKAERDEWRAECEKLKGFQKHMDDAKVKNKLQFEHGDLRALIEEMRQELNYEKDLNANLRLQLQKTQESNTELILAVQDLEEMLEQKNCEISEAKKAEEEDDELKALEDLVKDQKNDRKAYELEQKVMELYDEIELHMRDKDELAIQTEQLALDYEILKQENHVLSCKLEQCQLQEQLKMQHERSSSAAAMINELEKKIEYLENELKQQSAEYSNTSATIRELQSHVRSLEEELEKQGQDFEADLEAMTVSKVEQEKRAIRAEEALRKMRLRNAHTAEKLQEEFGRLSKQMASTFEANENVAMKALAEASELRSQRTHLEEALQKANEELRSAREKLHELSHQIKSNSTQIEQMTSELETKSKQLEHQDTKSESFSQEIQMLKSEINRLVGENSNLKEQAEQVETMRVDLAQMTTLAREGEMLIQTRNTERNELESKVILAKKESDKLLDELEKLRDTKDEKEILLELLQAEFQKLKVECNDLKHSLAEDEIEKEKLRKQILQLKAELKKEEASNSSEKKLKHNNGRVAATIGGNKTSPKPKLNPASHGPAEVANLREKIKMLERQIKSNENALETSENSFLQKEQDFCNRILELESRLEELNHLETSQEVTNSRNDITSHGGTFEETRRRADNLSNNGNELSVNSNTNSFKTAPTVGDSNGNLDELLTELSSLKEKNQSMENELKDMQERYSEISLKFAEVEGERQQLVMTVRNLKNAKRN